MPMREMLPGATMRGYMSRLPERSRAIAGFSTPAASFSDPSGASTMPQRRYEKLGICNGRRSDQEAELGHGSGRREDADLDVGSASHLERRVTLRR